MLNRDSPGLVRGIGPAAATATNMLGMIGVGPFITIPLLLSKMEGPQAMLGWILGAVVALCDGMVWAELGAAMPGTGGPLHYLSEAYGPKRLGRLISFLFIWQTIFLGPIGIASGAVGFAQYMKYLWVNLGTTVALNAMTAWQEKGIAMLVCLLITFLLYRDIRTVSRMSVGMWVIVIGTILWIAVAGLLNFDPKKAFDFPPNAFRLSKGFFFGLGGAMLIAMYDYGGYGTICFCGGEVRNPEKVIPRSIICAICGVAVLYLAMNLGIIGVVPWREAIKSTSIVSDFVQRLYGSTAARILTGLVLWATLASLFAGLLGLSRVPYGAAVEGRFFRVFARVHPTRAFPSFSVVFMGACSALACTMTLEILVSALIVIQVIGQFMLQVLAVTMIRRNRPDIKRPYSMPFYPWTSVVAFLGWFYILVASGLEYIAAGMALLAFGVATFMWRARSASEWPFERVESAV